MFIHNTRRANFCRSDLLNMPAPWMTSLAIMPDGQSLSTMTEISGKTLFRFLRSSDAIFDASVKWYGRLKKLIHNLPRGAFPRHSARSDRATIGGFKLDTECSQFNFHNSKRDFILSMQMRAYKCEAKNTPPKPHGLKSRP